MERKLKDSGIPWIQQIPEHWEVKRGKSIFQEIYRNVRPEDGVVTCFRDGEVTLRINRRTTGFTESDKEIGYHGVRVGDLVIHQMDAFAGSIGISDSDGKCSPICIVCQPRQKDKQHTGYYCKLLRVMAYSGFIQSLATGIRERSTDFRYKTLVTLSFPVPPLSEQEAISAYLDEKCGEIDELIAVEQQMISDLEAYRQAVITEAVTHGLNPYAPLRDSGIPWIGQIPEHWEITRVAKICYEHYVTNKIEHNQNLLSLSYGNIKRKNINTVDGLLPASFDTYQIVDEGNIVLRLTDLQNDKRSLRVGHVEERGIITSAYVALGMKPYVYSKYMYFLLYTADICKVFYSFGGGVRQSGKWDDIASLIISLPPLAEQKEIADYLDAKCAEIAELIKVKQDKIETMKQYRQSLIFEAVTGKINID